ncbi:DMT family transporter [Umezawaea sp. Da 62-37]|uniref:DMT family transporter n=1 Tax=Umezawaea sp. Da 62-37 TaxID=3075927 RepID=UPI0028F6F2EF|nr:DMT family transporter [Umezawaea sp. Da 62-37]WNV85138.1 DMT family transporter [Umezawaea sp. Da 62-37]
MVALGAGISAGLVWGLAFVLPDLLSGWSAVAVTVGRYLAYGVLSLVLFALGGAAVRRVARKHWRPAVAFGVAGNAGYYLLLVVGIQTVGAPVTNMVIGCIPVVMAVVGNRTTRMCPWRSLLVPVSLVAVGLVVVNALEISGAQATEPTSTTTKVLGLLACCGAVALWTWYGIANARFMAENPDVPAGQWATVVGVATGVVTVVALPLALTTGQFDTAPGATDALGFVAVALVLGVLVSWVATWLWNAASAGLSPTVAGMLVNIETLSGYTYVYAARREWPPLGQVLGFALIIVGVVLVIRLQKPAEQAAEPAVVGRGGR